MTTSSPTPRTTTEVAVGQNSRVVFTPPETGTHYVVVGSSDYEPEATSLGTYTLSLTDVTNTLSDDYPASADTAGTVTVGGSATGEIEVSHDIDWFAVTLDAGTTYRIDLKGQDTGSGTLYVTYLKGMYDANGNLIPGTRGSYVDDDQGNASDKPGYNTRTKFRPTRDGTYYVSARGADEYTGTYTVSVKFITTDNPDDFPAGTDTTGTLDVGGSTTGVIDLQSDQDWFAVVLEAGRTYRFNVVIASSDPGDYWTAYIPGDLRQ